MFLHQKSGRAKILCWLILTVAEGDILRLICVLVCVFMCVGVELEKQCDQMMMLRFGRMVDMEVLLTLSGNRALEELKQDKLIREDAYAKEMKEWDVR